MSARDTVRTAYFRLGNHLTLFAEDGDTLRASLGELTRHEIVMGYIGALTVISALAHQGAPVDFTIGRLTGINEQ